MKQNFMTELWLYDWVEISICPHSQSISPSRLVMVGTRACGIISDRYKNRRKKKEIQFSLNFDRRKFRKRVSLSFTFLNNFLCVCLQNAKKNLNSLLYREQQIRCFAKGIS